MKVEELKELVQGIEGIDVALVGDEELAQIAAKTYLGYVLFNEEKYFDSMTEEYFKSTLGKLMKEGADFQAVFESCRLAAAKACGSAHDIALYSHLRRCLERDDSAQVRAAAKESSIALEREFTEDACLEEYEHFTGGVDKNVDTEEAQASGNFYAGNLNDFR